MVESGPYVHQAYVHYPVDPWDDLSIAIWALDFSTRRPPAVLCQVKKMGHEQTNNLTTCKIDQQ